MDLGLKIGNKTIVLIDEGGASGTTLIAGLSVVLKRVNLNM